MKILSWVGRFLGGIGGVATTLSKKFYGKDMHRWYKDQGDKNLKLNYNLTKDSIVFDVGGYEGQFASDIFSKYCCSIYIFEPVLEFANEIKLRFQNNSIIKVFDFGLSNTDKKIPISINKDRSSNYKNKKNTSLIMVKDIKDFMDEYNITKIDLMKINIEGDEYELLERLINTEYIFSINYLLIQFHDFIPNAKKRKQKISEILSESHICKWKYEFVWENWENKKINNFNFSKSTNSII